MSITLSQYFIGRPHTQEQEEVASELLEKVNALLNEYVQCGGILHINPHTNSLISGMTEGGFRLPYCVQGKLWSSHKILIEYFDKLGRGAGIDIHDPDDKLDLWITDAILEKHGLYREHPDYTRLGSDGKPHPWCHLTTRAPASKKRSFIP